jgi:hypothetical protein
MWHINQIFAAMICGWIKIEGETASEERKRRRRVKRMERKRAEGSEE